MHIQEHTHTYTHTPSLSHSYGLNQGVSQISMLEPNTQCDKVLRNGIIGELSHEIFAFMHGICAFYVIHICISKDV